MTMGLVLCAIGGFVHGFERAIEAQTLRSRGDEFAAGFDVQWLQQAMPPKPSTDGPGTVRAKVL
jgi:hypothetical protein